MSRLQYALSLALTLSLLCSQAASAQGHVHPAPSDAQHDHSQHSEQNDDAVDHEAMNHGEMNHEEMNHDAMNHEAMNHEEMNHEEMNHGEINHAEMNHDAMSHDEMNHDAMNHEQMDHSSMDHSSMDHSDMDHGASNTGSRESMPMRDPHAYSGGYQRASGPYSLPQQPQVKLADETVFSGLWMDRFELVDHDAGQGAEMEGYGWFGNSYRRLLVQAQIETVEGEIEEGEVDLLVSRAISPFWDLRAGIHHSFGENVDRSWAAISLKGLAPYWFEVDATLHLGDNGRAALDVEAEYELLLTQRLVLQPRVDIVAFGKTDVELGRGSGLSSIKTGARLRYEFDRQFAPYIGVERVRRFGKTADLQPAGVNKSETHWVLGLRYWF